MSSYELEPTGGPVFIFACKFVLHAKNLKELEWRRGLHYKGCKYCKKNISKLRLIHKKDDRDLENDLKQLVIDDLRDHKSGGDEKLLPA
jgi:hypothetical protein